MMRAAMTRRWTATLGLALLAGCGGLGPSCGGCQTGNYTYPSKVMQGSETVDDAFRARLTERGLDFLARNLKTILAQQFPPDTVNPMVSRIPLPSQVLIDQNGGTVGGAICLKGNTSPQPAGCIPSNGTYDNSKVSAITLDLAGLEDKITVDFLQGNQPGIRLTMRDVYLGLDGRIWTEVKFFDQDLLRTDADCDLAGNAQIPGAPPGTLASLSIVADIFPRVSTNPAECQTGAAQCFMASIVVQDAQITGTSVGVQPAPKCTGNNVPAGCSKACSDLFAGGVLCAGVTQCNDNVLCPDPLANCECTDLFCPVYNFGAEVLSQFSQLLFTVLDPFLDTLLTQALRGALDNFNGQPLEFSGTANIASLLGNTVPALSQSNALGFTVSPTNNAFNVTCPLNGTASCEQRRGMDFLLKAGTEAVNDPATNRPAPAQCVSVIEGARFLDLYAATAFESADGLPLTGEFTGANGTPAVYDVAASLSRATLNQLGFSVYNAGVLCLALDSAAVHALTGGAFSLTAGTLDLLTGGRLTQYVSAQAPVLIALSPETPPVFTLGTGSATDPHIQFNLNKLHLSFYVLMYERWARAFEVTLDVGAGLNVVPDMQTRELNITVATGPTINNFTETYNELLPGVDFGDILPSLLNVFLGTLLSEQLSFNFDIGPVLSDALGGAPVFVVFEALQTERVNNRGEFLNLYLSFSDTNPNPFTLATRNDVQAADDVGTWVVGPDGKPRATGLARLEGVTGALPADHRYQVQVDFGVWSDWVAPTDGVLVVRDARLKLVGQHTVNVRAMVAGNLHSINPDVRSVRVWTDAAAPDVELTRGDAVVAVVAEDRAAPVDTLVMRYAVDNAAWSAWSGLADIPAVELAGAERLVVQVRDPARNVAEKVLMLRSQAAPEVAQALALQGGAAASAAGETDSGCACAVPGGAVPAGLLGLMVLGVFGRRRRRAV